VATRSSARWADRHAEGKLRSLTSGVKKKEEKNANVRAWCTIVVISVFMLENDRHGRAIEASNKCGKPNSRDIFLDQEYLTQIAFEQLGVRDSISPSDVSHVGVLLMNPELVFGLRVPYAVEVLGMPRAGKTTVINRYLQELWSRGERHKVTLVKEGARIIKQEFGGLRYSDPFQYSMLGGTATFRGYIDSLRNVNSGMRLVISDRGQVDRRVFRRAYFSQGQVNPEIMADEEQFMYGLENTPIQMGGVIILMIRPEETMRRNEKPGPIVNMDFLPRLYEQYWRLHWEVLQGEVPYRITLVLMLKRTAKKCMRDSNMPWILH